jgi:predicted GNAT family acetyltransferase
MSHEVTDNVQRRRFELELGAGEVAFIDYRRGGEGGHVLTLLHTEVPVARRGAGVGARLATATLELVRSRGERILPRCPYLVSFIERHPGYADLIAKP